MGFAVAFLLLAMIAALVFSAVDSAVHCRAGHLPGPWWTRFSTLSIMAYVPKFLSGTKHKLDFWLLSYYGRESGVVRFAPDSVLVADPILASAALATAGGWPKDPTFYGGNGKGTRNLFTHIDDKAHKELRRKMSPAFSIKSLNSFEPIIIASVTQDFLDRLARMSVDGNHEDLAKLFSLFTGDVIGNVGFGDQWNLVRTGHSIVLENSEKMVKGNDVPKMFLGRTVTRMLGLVSRTIRDGEAATEFIKNYAMKVVTDRRSGVTPRRDDLLQRLVDAKDPETGEMLTDKDIAHNTRCVPGRPSTPLN